MLRANLRGNLSLVALWRGATLDAAVGRWTPGGGEDEALGAVPFLANVFKAKLNSEFFLGEEKMTEWINDKDFTTLSSETHLHLPLKVHALVE